MAVAAGGAARALCQLHFEWDGGASVMYVQGTLNYGAGGPLTGRLAVLGGIGRWQVGRGGEGRGGCGWLQAAARGRRASAPPETTPSPAGQPQGAHGEDAEFSYDGKSGGGKIVLNCLDGVC